MNIVLAIDPGTKPGAAVLQDGIVTHASHRLVDIQVWQREVLAIGGWMTPWPLVATEGQWYYGARGRPRPGERRAVDVNDLLKLAFRAGWQLRDVPALRHLRVPPQVWRGGTSIDKAQMQRRILEKLTAAERKLFAGIPKSCHGDVLDAIGIGKWVASATPDEIAAVEWK